MNIDILIYKSQHIINGLVIYQLNHLNVASFSFIFLSGLFTSLSPCLVSILPLCVLYIAGENQELDQISKIRNLFFFCSGTISSFITLATIATLITKTYSKFFNGIPIISALIIVYMGLSLLDIVPFNTAKFKTRSGNTNQNLKMYLGGAGIGLALSSCSTPIFITLLVWISSSQQILLGLIFIIIYSTGYISPIIIGSIFSSGFLKIESSPFWSNLWNPFSGTILIGAGTFSLFSSLLS